MGEQNWTSMEDSPLSSIGEGVVVTNPMNQGEGRYMHVTYLIVSGGIEARRRYSEFQWLYQRILSEAPGAFVPIIPHKRTALIGESKYSPEFVEERRGNLQVFMKGVFQIPNVQKLSHSLVAFLTAPNDQLDEAKKKVEAANPSLFSTNDMTDERDNVAEAKKGFGNLLAKAKTVTKNKFGNMELLKTKDEEKIGAVKLYFDRMELHVMEMHFATEKLIKSTSDKLSAISDMGVKISEWKFSRDDFQDTTYGPEGRLMDDHQEIPKMMSAVAHFSGDIRSRMEEQVGAERGTLEQTLNRLALDITAFQRALNTRKKLQLAYTAKDNQVKQVKKQMDAASNNGKQKDMDKLSADLHELEIAARFLKAKLEECSSRILKESDRVRPEMEARLNGGLKSYAHVQMEYGDKIRDTWAKLMPKFEDEGSGKGHSASARLTTIALTESGECDGSEEPDEGAPEHPPPSAPVPEAPSELVTEEGPKDPVLGENGV